MRRLLVSSVRGFGDLKTKKKFHLSQFPSFGIFTLVHYLSLSLRFSVSFLVCFSFRFSFLVALDPSHSSFRNFFVRVCRIAKSEGRAAHFGDLIPSDCALHHLSKEFFALAFPALSTWKTIRDFMASEGNSWPLVRSEDLPEGLSDRGKGDHSSEETLSVSGSSRVVGFEDSWVARSYPSSISQKIHLLLSVRPLDKIFPSFFFWPICDFVLDLLLSVLAQVFLSLSLPILQWLPLICSFSGLTLSFLSLKQIPNLISVSKIRGFSLRIMGCLWPLTYMVQIYKRNIIQIKFRVIAVFLFFL